METKLEFIKTYTTDIPKASELPGTFIIDYTGITPILRVSNGTEWLPLDNKSSVSRAAMMSDLEDQLRKRDWNIETRIFTDLRLSEEDKGGVTMTTTTPPPTLETKELPKERLYLSKGHTYSESIPWRTELERDYVQISEDDLSQEFLDKFYGLYEELINTKPMKVYNNETVDLGSIHYYNLISSRDLEAGSSVIDLLSLAGTDYTSVINLNSLIDTSGNCSCNLVFGVEYTVSGKVYTKELSFDPFVVIAGNVESPDLVMKIYDYVEADYHDKCLRIFPISKEVTECIISYCYFRYDKLY